MGTGPVNAPGQPAIEQAVQAFVGTRPQHPPPFSAKKIRGVRAYKLARRNRPVAPAPVEVTVHSIDVLEVDSTRVRCRVTCDAGFYMRAFAHRLRRRHPCSPRRAARAGGHLYIVEPGREAGGAGPDATRQARFAERLDAALRRLNDDYAAHRAGGYGMDAARVQFLPPGAFAAWMKSRGRLGGQNKVPRIVNDPDLFAALRAFADGYGRRAR